jgi:hypothetical protein
VVDLLIVKVSSFSAPLSNHPVLRDFSFWTQIGGFDASGSPNIDIFGQSSFVARASPPNLDHLFEARNDRPYYEHTSNALYQ